MGIWGIIGRGLKKTAGGTKSLFHRPTMDGSSGFTNGLAWGAASKVGGKIGDIASSIFKTGFWFLVIAAFIDGVLGGILRGFISVINNFGGRISTNPDSFFWKGFTFAGLDVDYFANVIMGGGWQGIYDIFHFNIFFIAIIFVMLSFGKNTEQKHPMKVWLTLLLIAYLLSSIPILNKFLGFRSGAEIIFLILLAVKFMGKNVSKDDVIADIVLFWLFYNFWLFGVSSYAGGLAHLFFFVFFYLIFGMGKDYAEDRTSIKWWIVVIMLFDFILPGILQNAYPTFPIGSLPFLFFGVLLFMQVFSPSFWTLTLMIIVILYYFLAIAATTGLFSADVNERGISEEELEKRTEIFDIPDILRRLKEYQNKSLTAAVGNYEGNVDENAKKKLGVYIEDFGKGSYNYYVGETVILDATITAENFISEEEDIQKINLKLNCSATKHNEPIVYGEIYPNSEFSIETYDKRVVQCRFDKNKLKKGSWNVNMSAEFNFETQSYLKRYFVDKSVIDSLRRQRLIKRDIDVLKIAKINDLHPVTKNSVGPIQIETSDRMPVVITLSENEEARHFFGIKLKNAWKGSITNVSKLDIYLPEYVNLEMGQCFPFAMIGPLVPEKEGYENLFLYKLDDKVISSGAIKNFKEDIEQRCWISVFPNDKDLLLDPGDVTTRYFRMIGGYNYQLNAKKSIFIQEITT